MEVTLRQKATFEKLIKTYQPSEQALQLLGDMRLVILLGMTGGGRNTIINHLVAKGGYHFIVSDTTRPPKLRDGKMEETGVQYFFRSEDDILQDIRAGEFLEVEVIHNQQVSGISIRELKNANESGKIPVNEVDVGGTENIYRFKPDTDFFFIVPPSFDIWIKRLNGRELMSKQELHNRVDTAITVIKKALAQPYFKFVINDDSYESAMLIDRCVRGENDEEHYLQARLVAEEILAGIIRRRELEV